MSKVSKAAVSYEGDATNNDNKERGRGDGRK